VPNLFIRHYNDFAYWSYKQSKDR